MARLDRDPQTSGPQIQAFVGTGFRVDGVVHGQGVKLTPLAVTDWVAPDLQALNAAALSDLLSTDPLPEFLLLGTGAALRRPASALITEIEARGIGVEVMDSRAAARAWGVLRGEERWVVAALLPLDAA